MVTVEELMQKKEEMKLSCREISELTDVPFGTVQKIFSGETKNPRRETLLKLEKFFTEEAHKGIRYDTAKEDLSFVREPPYVYGSLALTDDGPWSGRRQGEYTVEDYLALPDDERYELIDGVLYNLASPSTNHQEVAGYLYYQLMNCVQEHEMPCRPYIAPLDVQLDRDSRTMLQPDVIVNCDPEKNIGPRLFGAPDFVAEVLSPATSNRDLIVKLQKYFHAGVREYWILDPKRRMVTVYVFGEEANPHLYSFEDDIPVAISDGLCTVSMRGVQRWLI